MWSEYGEELGPTQVVQNRSYQNVDLILGDDTKL